MESIRLALLGRSISHSRSENIYRESLKKPLVYKYFDFQKSSEIPSLENIFTDIDGLSITNPYKDHFLNDVIIDDQLKPLKAINCIGKRDENYYGTNTDYFALLDIIGEIQNLNQAIILGNGAMARVLIEILNIKKVSYSQIFRKQNGPLENLDLSNHSGDVIFNTCDRNFVFNGKVKKNVLFYDLNYDFFPHQEFFKNNNYLYIDGFDLLKKQAFYALKFWFSPGFLKT